MTKTTIKTALKGMHNEVRTVGGFNIARVCWKPKQWLVIENEETFNDAREDNFQPIEAYETQEQLIEALYKVINR